MDKRSLIGIGLITILVTIWLIYTSTNQQPKTVSQPQKTKQTDSLTVEEKKSPAPVEKPANIPTDDSSRLANKFGSFFSKFASGSRKLVTIETDLYKAVISNQGAAILRWELKKYKKWDKVPTQLIWNDKGELYLTFLTYENKKIDSRDLFFDFDSDSTYFRVTGANKLAFTAKIEIAPGKSITRTFGFYGNKYDFENDITIENLEDIIPGRGYNYSWDSGLRYQESNSVDESQEALAMVSLNGEIEEIDASGNDPVESSPTGMIDYAAVKVKYFTAAIIPQPYKGFDGTVDLSGRRYNIYKGNELINSTVEKYNLSFRVPYKGGVQKNSFKVYLGPLDYKILKKYDEGLEGLINFGLRWLIRPIGEYFMLPIFDGIYYVIHNYGISIIIFSIIIKILLYPLSIGQLKSAQKMQLLGPEMNKIREQYKDDQAKQQQETMKLYSEYGINPMGGCLPLLLQMPILYALWAILRTSIDLRQADFFLWITDLSIPDFIFDMGFKLPLIGINKFSGLALAMGVTMFIQQKMTVTDPRQKGLVYMMPVMFTLMFSNFPSGLNLYYFMFNLLSIGQQVYINKFSKNKLTLADLKRMPKKEGWLQKKMREAQDIAASQGKSIPGAPRQSGPLKEKPKPSKGSKSSPTQGKKKY